MRSACTRDDSTDCTCPRCTAAEDAFWREQEGEPDPDMPPDDYEFDVSDLDDVTPLPPAPVVRVHILRCDGSHTAGICHDPECKFRNPARSRAKRRR